MVTAEQTFEHPVEPRSLIQRHRLLMLCIAVVLIAGTIWTLEGGRTDESLATSVSLKGSATGRMPRIGEQAPDFALPALNGGTMSLADLQGRPVIINFWASWCPPCRGEMPDLEKVARDYRADGVVLLAVNLEEEPEAVRSYANTLGLSFPVVLDRSGDVAARYNLVALPTTYFVDASGTIRDQNIGALTAIGLRGKVEKLVRPPF